VREGGEEKRRQGEVIGKKEGEGLSKGRVRP